MGRYDFTRGMAVASSIACLFVWLVTIVAWWATGYAAPLCTLWCLVLDTLLGD